MKDINLIAKSLQQKREHQNSGMGQKLLFSILIVLLVGALGYGVLAFLKARLVTKEEAIAQKIKEAAPIVELKKNILVKEQKITQLSEVIDMANAQSILNTKILDGISKVLPEDVFIVNYAVSQAGELNIIGKARDMDSIAYFVHELKESGLFSDVYLSNVSSTISKSSDSNPTGITEYNFSALLTLKK
ncbi:PilN domain-containing protein [Desulfosporosinus meridiei]|uniref:Tfp pilus assembly protein PilN n=1 Tax=Desulfosporosinus meridiei (strain ATCC BAA-275 / DSM 13257 / KCTC 12902 / NCIMB 13706 / S10) TaxID=768704 RepID=J7IWC3_DESMD|nr:PilN domain-containing protein [Desulfosporosinus meridiei]AFQ43006.1 Tfp pilus assembly protein PilN [Desulfosporosinus meridiei DSM 13257]